MGFLFPDSREFSFRGFSLELVPSRAGARRELLERIREDALLIAARSRGWDDESMLEHFRRHFKIGPLYETNTLALVRREGRLLGLAGAVDDWRVGDCSLVHLCSVALMPEAQARGIIPALMGALWELSTRNERLRHDLDQGRAFVTAITQSPYLIAYLHKLFETYPGPGRRPDEQIKRIARAVVERFDPHLPLDEEELTLRGEANFFYRRIPYSTDREINQFCDTHLKYDAGDVFVVVGRVIPERLQPYQAAMQVRYPELFSALGQWRLSSSGE